jgi:hypothetical protein
MPFLSQSPAWVSLCFSKGFFWCELLKTSSFQFKYCANVARNHMKPISALEILALRNLIGYSPKEHPCLSLMKSASLGVSALAIKFYPKYPQPRFLFLCIMAKKESITKFSGIGAA